MTKPRFDRPLPSQHEREREKLEREREEADRKRAADEAQLRADVDGLLKTEAGCRVWKWLFDRCGYARPILGMDMRGEVAPLKTECQAAIREVYRELRRKASPELLAKAEFFAEFGVREKQPLKGEVKNG